MRIGHLSKSNQVAIATGYFAVFFSTQAIHALATPYYQMSLALDPLWLNVSITSPLLLSMLLSPAIGRICDQLVNLNKKKLLKLSGWIAGSVFALLWFAPINWQGTHILMYLASLCLIFYVAVSVQLINLRSVTYSVSCNSEQSVRVMSFSNIFERLGAILYFWLFPLAQWSGWSSLTQGVRGVGVLVGILFIALLTHISASLFELRTHGKVTNSAPLPKIHDVDLHPLVKRVFVTLLLLLLTKLAFITALTSLDFYLLVYFVESGSLADGAMWKGVLSSAFALFSLILIVPVGKLTLRFGAKNTLVLIFFFSFVGSVAKWFIFSPGNQYWLILDALLGAASFVAIGAIIPSMINQLSIRHSQLTGVAQHGFFASRQSIVMQGSIIISLLLSGILIDSSGFDAALKGAQHSETILLFRIALSPGSAVLNIISLLLVLSIPNTWLEQSKVKTIINKTEVS